ncbi:MAG: hypothetical protein JWN76_514 [Chitinophagaceae bacterium]|nr:hypothetical protein [Chitinophagaceae bacterium]
MEKQQETYFTSLKTELKGYLGDRLELVKLQGVKGATRAASAIAILAVLVFLSFFILLFSGFALGYYLAVLIGSTVAGFAIVIVFYLLLVWVCFKLKKKFFTNWVAKKVIDIIIPNYKRMDIESGK